MSMAADVGKASEHCLPCLLQWTGGPVLSRLTIYGKNGISETITHEYFRKLSFAAIKQIALPSMSTDQLTTLPLRIL